MSVRAVGSHRRILSGGGPSSRLHFKNVSPVAVDVEDGPEGK